MPDGLQIVRDGMVKNFLKYPLDRHAEKMIYYAPVRPKRADVAL